MSAPDPRPAKVWFSLPETRRCKRLGHRWVFVIDTWVCARYRCEAWFDPQCPDPLHALAEEWYRDLPPLSHDEH